MPGGSGLPGSFILLLAAAIIAVAAFFGFAFRVDPDEPGIVIEFGKLVRSEPPDSRLPNPIEEMRLATSQNIAEIGMRSSEASQGVLPGPEESLMLTGENIVDINFFGLLTHRGCGKIPFQCSESRGHVRDVAESAMRDMVGQSNIQPLLTGARQRTEQAVQKLMQDVVD